MRLTHRQIRRYSRHLIMPEVGVSGQERICAARVLCIGAGGLGSPLALYLAAAGVGTIGIVDHDRVDFSNLQRQILHSEATVGQTKVESARERLSGLNSDVRVVTYAQRLDSSNIREIIADYDVVVDGTDNFPTRYLVNDACALAGKPNVYGSIFRFDGQASVFWAAHGPCYRCLYPEPPPPGLVPSCAEGGVLGVLPGIIGGIQATETIKLILGRGDTLVGRLLLFDALHLRFREVKLRKDPDCPLCGRNPTIRDLVDYEEFCGLRSEEAQQLAAAGTALELLPQELAALRASGVVQILDVREPVEWDICGFDGAHRIPLGELPRRLHELDTATDLVAVCHRGIRSLQAVYLLRQHGFTRVKSLRGGLDAWASVVDPEMPRY